MPLNLQSGLSPEDFLPGLLNADPAAAIEARAKAGALDQAYAQAGLRPSGVEGILQAFGLGPSLSDQMAARQAVAQQQAIAADQQRQLRLQAAQDQARQAVLADPSAANFSRLIALDPERYQGIRAAHDLLDEDQRNSELRNLATLRGYIASGDAEGFRTAVQAQMDAARSRQAITGRRVPADTAHFQHWIDASKTPEGLRNIAGELDMGLAVTMGPDKAAEAINALRTGTETQRHNRALEDQAAADLAQRTQAHQDEMSKPVVVGNGSVLVAPNGQGGAPAPAARASAPAPTGGVYDQVATIAGQAGANEGEQVYLRRLAQVESGGDPRARNGSSTGVFQFHPDTFARAGGGDINSVADQTRAALNLARNDAAALRQAGVEVSPANVYLLHQQGQGGGIGLLSAPPEVGAVAALTPYYRNPDTALAAIAGNIGMPYRTPQQKAAANARAQQMTSGEFVDFWRNRWSGQQAGQGQAQSGGARVLYDNSQPQGDDAPLSAAAVDLAAGKYLRDGTLPTFGGGKVAAQNKTLIYNRAAEMARSLGLTADDIIAGTADTKALASGLREAVTRNAALTVSEQTLQRNLDYVRTLAPTGVGGTGSPIINRFIQHARGEYAGDPAVTRYDNALHGVADEFAKILTTTTGTSGTALTDSAREEAYRRLSSAQNIDQLQAAIEVIKTEAGNRIQSARDVEASIRARLRAGAGGAAPVATDGAPQPQAMHSGYRNGPDGKGSYPVFTQEQRDAAAKQGHRGKYYDQAGNLREIR